MKPYSKYVRELHDLISQVRSAEHGLELKSSVEANLNGRASRELRNLVDLDELRRNGAFFTGTKLSALLIAEVKTSLTADSRILDPACGAGDLLLACAREFAKRESPGGAASWIKQLHGRDLHHEFISAASARLTLAAMTMGDSEHKRTETPQIGEWPHLQATCGLTDTNAIRRATHILLNPPFTAVDSPLGCSWAEGKVNLAAVFIDNCLHHAVPGTRIAAILPDVLRSGSRYERWRQAVERRASVEAVNVYGKFDSRTDVDVFLLTLTAGQPHPLSTPVRWLPNAISSSALMDHFDVSVGPVVQYRDPHRGPWTPYARAGNAQPWCTLDGIQQKRRWSGKTVEPPFIVVRRTSAPGDQWRAPATLILGNTPMAIDNHLIVLRPKSGGTKICEKLLLQLKSTGTNNWLNDRIRCRHLTVSALKELPFEVTHED